MTIIDLRSDTVTRPTPAMREAMLTAPVGDDVWGDDPSVLQLQNVLAERAGKEAGLFLPTGTQSNLAALMAHCERGMLVQLTAESRFVTHLDVTPAGIAAFVQAIRDYFS